MGENVLKAIGEVMRARGDAIKDGANEAQPYNHQRAIAEFPTFDYTNPESAKKLLTNLETCASSELFTRTVLEEKEDTEPLLGSQLKVDQTIRVLKSRVAEDAAFEFRFFWLSMYEALMTAEDRFFVNTLRAGLAEGHHVYAEHDGLNVNSLVKARDPIRQKNLHPMQIMFCSSSYTKMMSDETFSCYFDPITKYEDLLRGRIGMLIGSSVYSDAFRHPQHAVLAKGEVWHMVGASMLGKYEVGPTVIDVSENEDEYVWHVKKTFTLSYIDPRGYTLLEERPA